MDSTGCAYYHFIKKMSGQVKLLLKNTQLNYGLFLKLLSIVRRLNTVNIS